MSSTTCFHLLLLISVAAAAAAIAAADDPTVYQVLESYDLPVGILPKGVVRHELDQSTGKLTVYLGKTCSFTKNGHELEYSSTISGTISRDKIKDLKGIKVKVNWFLKVSIVEVTRHGDVLDLASVYYTASVPVDNFYESPQCGGGLDCVNAAVAAGKKSDQEYIRFKRILPLFEV